MGGAHLQAENISHLDRAIALKPFSLRSICQATALGPHESPSIIATRLLADIHPFVELGDWLTLFEWAFREDTRIRAEACFLVSSNFVYVLDNANEIRSCFARHLLALS